MGAMGACSLVAPPSSKSGSFLTIPVYCGLKLSRNLSPVMTLAWRRSEWLAFRPQPEIYSKQ